MSTKRKAYCVFAIAISVLIILCIVCIHFFSQRRIIYDNKALHEYTWRYNSSIMQEGKDVLISTYDKITKKTMIQRYSPGEEGPVRTVIVDSDLEEVTVLDKNGNVLSKEPINDYAP